MVDWFAYTYLPVVWFWFRLIWFQFRNVNAFNIIWTISSIRFDFQWNSKPFSGCKMNILCIKYLCRIAIYESWNRYSTHRNFSKRIWVTSINGILCYVDHLNFELKPHASKIPFNLWILTKIRFRLKMTAQGRNCFNLHFNSNVF